MAYKTPATVQKIYSAMAEYLEAMHLMGRKPQKPWLKRKDYSRLLEHETKILRVENPKANSVTEVSAFRGFDVGQYQ